MDERQMIIALAALAHPQRLRAYRALVIAGHEGMTPSVMADGLGIARSALSFHLKELLQGRLVTSEQSGRNLIYRAEYDRMNSVVGYLTENCCAGGTCAVPQPASCACRSPSKE